MLLLTPWLKVNGYLMRICSFYCASYLQSRNIVCMQYYGLFPDTDSATDSDSDSKPDGYIVLYRNCFHCMHSDSDCNMNLYHQSLLQPFLGKISGSGSHSVSGHGNKPLLRTKGFSISLILKISWNYLLSFPMLAIFCYNCRYKTRECLGIMQL